MAQSPMPPPPPDSLRVNGGKDGFQVEASGERVFETLVEIWRFTLVWIGEHPILFVLILAFLAFQGVLGKRAKVEIARMRLDYEAKRDALKPPSGPGRRGRR